ncbi:transcriptional regulator with XRE-family HTH domain [Amycolatopsis cihanbeyliensis]|uniref:Transcriptional regulator with XRE-family HTH domain n=1 Tax=Amycolatopsis cihanbeyliensis TaxID=1128664 RepID=A0A542DPZ6_AMYCI|nr:transcriptional regulator with XRE-family HTH domain [Amycolatopsis cihanbeyliensis]
MLWHVGGSTRTPKARALGAALAEARRERGLSQRGLATKTGKSPGTIARWETGDRVPDPEDVAAVLTALEISGERYADIHAMATGTREPRWLAVTLPEQRQQLNALLECGRTATTVTDVSPLLVPGVLQNSEYVRAIMEAGGVPQDEVETRVAVRVGRRELITRAEPAEFVALLGEAALRQVIGSREVLVKQLRYLLELGELPNVHLRVLPFDSGWHPALEGPFVLIESTEDDPVVHLELRDTGLFLHEPEDVARYRRAIDAIGAVALDPRESAGLIAGIAAETEGVP